MSQLGSVYNKHFLKIMVHQYQFKQNLSIAPSLVLTMVYISLYCQEERTALQH